MALIQCPECGKEISDQSPACIHCGYPLSPTPVPEEPVYSVALLDAAPGPNDTLDILQNQLGMSFSDAAAAIDNVPSVLARNLTMSEAHAMEGLFTKYGRVKILRDENAATKDAMLGAEWIRPQAEQEENKQGLGFFGVVGAVVVGIVLTVLLLSLF